MKWYQIQSCTTMLLQELIRNIINLVTCPTHILQTKNWFCWRSPYVKMMSPFKFTCEGNSLVKPSTSNHITNRRMVNFILNFWPINSQEISKWFIYTYAAGSIRGHLNFKILLRKFSAIGESFIKIPQSIPT